MSILSYLAIGGAFANYRKAKKAYDEAKAEEQAALSAINLSSDYEAKRDEQYEQLLQQGTTESDGNSRLQNVQVAAIIRVGNLVGSFFKANISLIFSNTSKTASYNIFGIKAQGNILGEYLRGYEASTNVTINLKAGESKEIELGGASTSLDGATLDKLRNTICEACGKKLITSCQKINIQNIGYADVEFKYGSGTTYAGETRAAYRGIPCVVRYCGEAFYPNKY